MPFQIGFALPGVLKGEDGLFHGVTVEMATEAPTFCPGPLGHRAKDPLDFTQPLGRQLFMYDISYSKSRYFGNVP
jgi:hypothetical protein